MKSHKRRKQDKVARHAALGAVSTAAAHDGPGQTPLPFENDTLPMNASQHDLDDRNDAAPTDHPTTDAVSAIARFDTAAPDDDGREIFVMPPEHAHAPRAQAHSPGARLRAAREAGGMDLEQAASRLRLPQRLLQAIEADDYSRIEHGVYLRGYLTSYARLVGLPETEFAQSALQERQAPPPLVATGQISHSRYLYQRYSVPAVYLLLTGLIVGPSVWLATHGGLERNLARLSTLDAPATPGTTPLAVPPASAGGVSTASGSVADNTGAADSGTVPPVEEPPVAAPPATAKPADQQPLMASLAPFTAATETHPVPPTAPVAVGTHTLQLKLSEASWVEINADDGRKLEYAILPAGSERHYSSASPLWVRIGNTTGAEVVLDGKPADLAPYRRSNVAYFRAFGSKGDIAGAE